MDRLLKEIAATVKPGEEIQLSEAGRKAVLIVTGLEVGRVPEEIPAISLIPAPAKLLVLSKMFHGSHARPRTQTNIRQIFQNWIQCPRHHRVQLGQPLLVRNGFPKSSNIPEPRE